MKKSFRIYQVDAFSNKLFKGNPAAVVPLDDWLSDKDMQNIAMENNLSETAFFIPTDGDSFSIRWFTPSIEVNLCGHATLASAHVIFQHLDFSGIMTILRFQSRKAVNLP
jgi:PhzF family phenazine biosynthesis protein